MKAAVYENIETIVIRDVELPRCGIGDIIIKVHACGICGSDIRNFYSGLKGNVKSQVMGHEAAGEVVEVGINVEKFSVGDRVAIAPDVSCGECFYCKRGHVNLCVNHRMIGTHWAGGFAEYLHLSSVILERGMVHHIPDNLSYFDATLSEPAASVLASQEIAQVGLGDTVLIIGAGPIGCLQLEVARARGASKIIVAGRSRLDMLMKFNPDCIIDVNHQDTVAEVLKFTGGLGVDKAFCANPVVATQQQAVESVRKRGVVILFGGVPKNAPMTTLNSNLIHYNEISVLGSFSYQAIKHQQAIQMLTQGKISASNYLGKRVNLDNIVDGFLLAKGGKALKVVVTPWGN